MISLIHRSHSPPPSLLMAASSPATRLPVHTGENSTDNNNRDGVTVKKKHLTLIPLIFLIYFEVSGGPYGEEPAVQAAGPLFAIVGFLIFPFIWSVPEALITAELATAYPGNGGYVLWASAAFGGFWGHLMGSWKFLSGVINNAAYPVLMADYLGRAIPQLSSSHGGATRGAAIVASTVVMSFLNYLGLTIVGYGGVILGVISLSPFVLMTGFSLPKLNPERWLVVVDKGERDWSLFFNTLFWNLNFWDNASTLAGEVENPQKTFPKALLLSGLLTCLGYLLPLLAGTGALDVPSAAWDDGFLADAAGMVAGKWLKIWISAGSVMSSVGLYEAQLSSCAYQLVGMADLGLLPRTFSHRARLFDTPWLAIIVSTIITLALSFMDFTNIIMAANFIYALSMLLEFAAFLWLRHKLPGLDRPYRVPMGLPGLSIMCLVPSVFLVLVMAIGNWIVYTVGFGLTCLGIGLYFVMRLFRSRGWMKFSDGENALFHGGGR